MLDQLQDMAPTAAELAQTTDKGMPEQVAIGFLRAHRQAHSGKRGIFSDLFTTSEPRNPFGGLFPSRTPYFDPIPGETLGGGDL